MNRRQFIRTSALAGGGLVLTVPSLAIMGNQHERELPQRDGALGDLLRIAPDGQVSYQCIKHEMGQGVSTAMAMIIAEELCADWQQITIEFPDTDLKKFQNDKYGGHDTGGSCTLIYQWEPLRQAGAVARELLIAAAAKQWNTTPDNCYAKDHFVVNRLSSQRIGFGALATLAAQLAVPSEVVLKHPKDFQLIGQSKPARLIPSIVTGSLQYGIDVKRPGMLYAVIARCPVFKGKLKGFDAAAALKVKGVKKVFTTKPIAGLQTETPYMPHDIREGVVVVADSFWAAKKGREALVINWDGGLNAQYNSEDFKKLAAQRAQHRTDPTGFVGDAHAVADVRQVSKTLHASYVFPHQLHSCMEPLNCTAHTTVDGCEVWLGSQAPNLVVTELQRLFRFAEDRIKVHCFPSGGGFGRRYYPDMAVEAVFISREAGHVPVKMIWTREDDHQCNLAHLFQHMEYQAAFDKDNNLFAWYEKEICTYTWGAKYADAQLPDMAYHIPNIRYDFENMIGEELVHSSAWRGVIAHGRFYSECFIDELAAFVKKDPYAFRLGLLEGDREIVPGSNRFPAAKVRRVLNLAAEKAEWGKKLEPGSAQGMAVCPYGTSCCAVIAEVLVRDHTLTVTKIVIGVDCGKVVNPSGASNQITGGIVWGLTALLYGGLPIIKGRAVHTNFHQNKLLRMHECPDMEVYFVESKDERPQGVGEISSPLAIPAVLNAIYAATGKRIRTVPLDLSLL